MHIEPTRAAVDCLPGFVLLEFGADWCGYCQAIRSQVAALLQAHPNVRHIKVADGRGLPLGRSFRVKLWPTLVFLKDGQIVRQLVRPDGNEIAEAFAGA